MDIPFPRARCIAGTNGYAMVRLEDGDGVFIGSNRGGVAREQPLKLSREDVEYIAGFDVVHTSNNSWLDGELEKLDGIQTAVSYDFSGKWNEEERRNAICPHIDYAFLSCSGLEPEQVREVCDSMLRSGARAVVATMGGKGAMYADAAGEMIQPPEWVEPVDTWAREIPLRGGTPDGACPDRKTAESGHGERAAAAGTVRCSTFCGAVLFEKGRVRLRARYLG